MKNTFLIALALLVGIGVFGWLGYTHLMQQAQAARSEAVDGCMQNARMTWQNRNEQNPEFINVNEEPNRYWYKVCMEEKGFSMNVEI